MKRTGLYVIEAWDGKVYLGRVQRTRSTLIIRSGFQGHPVMLPTDDVQEVVAVEDHPQVVFL